MAIVVAGAIASAVTTGATTAAASAATASSAVAASGAAASATASAGLGSSAASLGGAAGIAPPAAMPGGGLLSAAQHPGATHFVATGEKTPDFYNVRNSGQIFSADGQVARLANEKFGGGGPLISNKIAKAGDAASKEASVLMPKQKQSEQAQKAAEAAKPDSYLARIQKYREEKAKEDATKNLNKDQRAAWDMKEKILAEVLAGNVHNGQLDFNGSPVWVAIEMVNKVLGLPKDHTRGIRIPK